MIVKKSVFKNEEINSFINVVFTCGNCNKENSIKITPYETGYPFTEVYKGGYVLTVSEILANKLVTKTSNWASYVGGLPANNRVTTPKNAGFTKSFVESHRISNYGWIFTTIQPGGLGYVKPRK